MNGKLRNALRGSLPRIPPAYRAFTAIRARQAETAYRNRRDHYQQVCSERGLRYNRDSVRESLQERLAERNYTPLQRDLGDVHTFAAIPRIGWHSHLYPDLHELGPVTEFDYLTHGYHPREFYRANHEDLIRRRAMNDLLLKTVVETHEHQPIDWVFIYSNGTEVSRSTIEGIQEKVGVPVVNMCLDDKQSWTGPDMGDHVGGQIGVAPSYDISWTSARVALDWYVAEGGRPIYLPEGANIKSYRPMDVPRDIPTSFIGAAYGSRRKRIRWLQAQGINVETYGPGWGTRSAWGDEAVEVFNRSQVNLGMGEIGYSDVLTNVKTRDFEVPACGGGAYLTSYNRDLAEHFDIGREIACYRGEDELIESLLDLQADPDKCQEMATRARLRTVREHRWLHRYMKILQELGIMEPKQNEVVTVA